MDFPDRLVETVIDPLVDRVELDLLDTQTPLRCSKERIGGVPDLVGKATAETERIHVDENVPALRRHVGKGEIHRIGAVLIDDLHGSIPLPSDLLIFVLLVPNQTGDVDVFFRPHQGTPSLAMIILATQKKMMSYPVVKLSVGKNRFKSVALPYEAEGGERQEPRAEPGIKHIRP